MSLCGSVSIDFLWEVGPDHSCWPTSLKAQSAAFKTAPGCLPYRDFWWSLHYFEIKRVQRPAVQKHSLNQLLNPSLHFTRWRPLKTWVVSRYTPVGLSRSRSFFGNGLQTRRGAVWWLTRRHGLSCSSSWNNQLYRSFEKTRVVSPVLGWYSHTKLHSHGKILWNQDSLWGVLLNLLDVTVVLWLGEKKRFSFEMHTKKIYLRVKLKNKRLPINEEPVRGRRNWILDISNLKCITVTQIIEIWLWMQPFRSDRNYLHWSAQRTVKINDKANVSTAIFGEDKWYLNITRLS